MAAQSMNAPAAPGRPEELAIAICTDLSFERCQHSTRLTGGAGMIVANPAKIAASAVAHPAIIPNRRQSIFDV